MPLLCTTILLHHRYTYRSTALDMTLNECATRLEGNTFIEIFELTESFLLEMQENALCLAFCPDRDFFHIVGAHNEILELDPDPERHYDIHVFRDAEGGYNFRIIKDEEIIDGGETIRLRWEVIAATAGYVLSWDRPGKQVTLNDESHVCKGLVFSLNEIK